MGHSCLGGHHEHDELVHRVADDQARLVAVKNWDKGANRHVSLEWFIYTVNELVKPPKAQNMSIGRGVESVEKGEGIELEEIKHLPVNSGGEENELKAKEEESSRVHQEKFS